MNCPKCGGQMWDNRANKKNPKGPDFTCKDASCKFVQNPVTNEWEMSAYKTGVWEKKPFERPANLPPKTPMVANPAGDGYVPTIDYAKKEQDKVEGMVRHGVICAMITAGYDREKILMEYQDWCDLIINGTPI